MPRRKTTKEYIKECREKGLDLPVEDYVNAHTKIKHKCNKGHIYKQTPHNHLYGYGCKKCSILYISAKRIKSPEDYYNECKSKGYDLPVEDYIKDSVSIKHVCIKGHIYKQKPTHHLQGAGCTICGGTKKKTSEEYLQECKEKGLDLPIENYRGNKIKIKHKCKQGHIYTQMPTNHLRGKGCSICNESHGERFIRNYLDRHSIKYISQKRFSNCKDVITLPFDFYLPDYSILIEYQGQQHFTDVDYFYNDRTCLKDRKHKDYLKAKYAKENGYKLLRPTYKTNTQEKINKYLDRYLVKSLDK